ILFSQKKIHKPRWMNVPTYSFWHPLSAHYFVLCSEKMLSSEDIMLLDRPEYCVNKTEFLAMLSSWSVTLPRG
ncbi:MAG: hypothetical protein IIX67_01525, partial [Clostridia bacterium]|nr:hypothetical protein [Clostridia bacterium]